jgi:membrane-bound serine protease (ClpP class)
MTFIEMLGPTAVPTLICLIVGFILLVIEMFIPGIGLAGVSGVIALIAVVVMQLGWGNPRVALYVIAIALLVIILGLVWIIRSFQKGRLSKSFLVLQDSSDGTSVPEIANAKADLLGKSGVAVTTLRPAGIAEIEGRRVDVTTAGEFIPKGSPVTVVKAEGMHILVNKSAE